MEKEDKNTESFKPRHYGDVLAYGYNAFLVSYEELGEYNGDYLAVLIRGDKLLYFRGWHGPQYSFDTNWTEEDWLEGKLDENNGELKYDDAVEYCKEHKPIYVVPKSMPLKFVADKNDTFWRLDVKTNKEFLEIY